MVGRLSHAQGLIIKNTPVWYLGCDDDGCHHVWFGNREHILKEYFREERTLDDHMGNTPCGRYVILPLPGGKRIRAYLD